MYCDGPCYNRFDAMFPFNDCSQPYPLVGVGGSSSPVSNVLEGNHGPLLTPNSINVRIDPGL